MKFLNVIIPLAFCSRCKIPACRPISISTIIEISKSFLLQIRNFKLIYIAFFFNKWVRIPDEMTLIERIE